MENETIKDPVTVEEVNAKLDKELAKIKREIEEIERTIEFIRWAY